MYGIRVHSLVGQMTAGTFMQGWVKYYDADAHGGRGQLDVTTDPTQAKGYATVDEAHAEYLTVSKRKPWRDDGRPNRPMTAFTVSLEWIPTDGDNPKERKTRSDAIR